MITLKSALACAALVASATALGACGADDREAQARSGLAEAEVSTEAPANQVSDQQLQAAAQDAADAAAGIAADASVNRPPDGLSPDDGSAAATAQ